MNSQSPAKKGSLIGGALLVAGTAIGGGMLALPVLTSLGGFAPSLALYFFCWLFMLSTGLLLLELSLTYGEGANLVTMAEKTLGRPGKWAAWILYLFLFYCLTIAYMVGCGDMVSEAFNSLFGGALSEGGGAIAFTLIFAPFVWAGARVISPLNSVMMALLGLLYLSFIILGAPFVKKELLLRTDWKLSLIALPIAFTSFAFQGIIPTLSSYLHFDGKKLRQALIIGSFIPLVAYAIWQWLILGLIPVEGPFGLKEALAQGKNAVYPLKHFLHSPSIWLIGQFFAFLALLTSFFGVTLGLLDFLSDGLKIQKNRKGRLILSLLIFLPPLLFTLFNPHIFLIALGWAGGYGCALLLGLMPILMVGAKRYRQGNYDHLQLRGGKPILLLLVLFILFELAIEVAKEV